MTLIKHNKAKKGNTFKIKTKTLTEILDENNAPNTIDYMSLETGLISTLN